MKIRRMVAPLYPEIGVAFAPAAIIVMFWKRWWVITRV